MHREFAGLQGAAQLLDELEVADRLLVHAGREDGGAATVAALGLVEGDVGLLDEVGAVAVGLVEDHDADAGVLFEHESVESEGLGEHVEQAHRHVLGLVDRGQVLGQVEELVPAESRQRVRRASHQFEAARDARSGAGRPRSGRGCR